MSNDEYRAEQQEARRHGLRARQETREARAIRRQVAEEIAKAIEDLNRHDYQYDEFDVGVAAGRDIGSQPTTDATQRSPQEPCVDPECPHPLMHTHPWLNGEGQ